MGQLLRVHVILELKPSDSWIYGAPGIIASVLALFGSFWRAEGSYTVCLFSSRGLCSTPHVSRHLRARKQPCQIFHGGDFQISIVELLAASSFLIAYHLLPCTITDQQSLVPME